MTDIDISPEAVEHLCAIHEGYEQHGTVATLRALSAALTKLQQGQPYRYIGKDMKTILARDLEDQRDAALAALTQSRAETAAAYERAAKQCDKIAGNTADFPRDHRRAAGQCASNIRALATPDQSSALTAIEAAAEARGMRKAAEIANSLLVRSSFGTDQRTVVTYSDFVAAVILAAIPQGDA